MQCDYKVVVDGTSNSAAYFIKRNRRRLASTTSKQRNNAKTSPTGSGPSIGTRTQARNGVISYRRKGRKLYILQCRDIDSIPNSAQAVANYATSPQYWPGKLKYMHLDKGSMCPDNPPHIAAYLRNPTWQRHCFIPDSTCQPHTAECWHRKHFLIGGGGHSLKPRIQ